MKIKKVFGYVLPLLLAVGCVDELTPDIPVAESDELIPVNIDGSINQVATKATAAGFVDKDALGLYAVNYTDNNTVAGILAADGNQANNVKYIFDEPNHKWNPVKTVYYKNVNTNVDLYVYYPYQSFITDVTAGGIEVRQDQSTEATATSLSGYEASDFLWGKAENVTPTESKIAISLKHRLSSVQVTLVEGTGFSAGEFVSLEKSMIVTNTIRKATADYSTGVVTPFGNPQADGIVMCPQDNGSWRAIVIPQTIAGGEQLFAITIDGMSYKFRQPDAVTYQAGKLLDVEISVNKKSPAGDFEFTLTNTQIVDWVEDRNTHGGEARQYFVVNVETPGTLGATIESMGKNPRKIKNLKVTGTINNLDFLFMRDEMTLLEALNLKEAVLKCVDRGTTHEENYAFVANMSGEEKLALIQQYGYPDWIDYDNGNEYNYFWYPLSEKKELIPERAFYNKKTLCYFVFPEHLESIGHGAFCGSNISGPLILPEGITVIWNAAFYGTQISSVTFPSSLQIIDDSAFSNCFNLSGSLLLPSSLKQIGMEAFDHCNFSGCLHLPNNLEEIGSRAFWRSGNYSGDLVIPEKIRSLQSSIFQSCKFSGGLFLSNVTEFIGTYQFSDCGFNGELVIPEGVMEIPGFNFDRNNFSSIVFPKSLKNIGEYAFYNNGSIIEGLEFKEGLISIGENAFGGCSGISSIHLPSTLQAIRSYAFDYCIGISKIVCDASEPPIAQDGAFNGVSKDNFTVEVPSGSVKRYQSTTGWGDFRRISAHYDFSVSRDIMRGLNNERPKTYVLRCPSGFEWSIQSKPDWVDVCPEHGIGKTDVTITFSNMGRTDTPMYDLDNINERIGTGRNGEVVFALDGKDYTTTLTVEQYDSDYSDGEVMTLQTATVGNGVDIIFIGDGYDAKDIATDAFVNNVNAGYAAYFGLEPYSTYKDYFNVYAVVAESDDSGIGSVNTEKDSKFGSYFTQNRILVPDASACFSWASKAKNSFDFTKTLVIMLQNASVYEGVTMMYSDGSAIACCPVSTNPYPYDFRGIIQHEAGGHGFGKLGDEYIYHNAFIQTCDCQDGCEHPKSDDDLFSEYGTAKSLGWYRNLSMSSDPSMVPWSHLLYHSKYSDYVDIYEGGYMHSRGVFRSEATSCMNNNIPYFSAISRQAIVERIMDIAGETFSLENFYLKDSDAFGTKASASSKYTPELIPSDGRERNYPIFMGEHPEF